MICMHVSRAVAPQPLHASRLVPFSEFPRDVQVDSLHQHRPIGPPHIAMSARIPVSRLGQSCQLPSPSMLRSAPPNSHQASPSDRARHTGSRTEHSVARRAGSPIRSPRAKMSTSPTLFSTSTSPSKAERTPNPSVLSQKRAPFPRTPSSNRNTKYLATRLA